MGRHIRGKIIISAGKTSTDHVKKDTTNVKTGDFALKKNSFFVTIPGK